jgi:hypothetical protein
MTKERFLKLLQERSEHGRLEEELQNEKARERTTWVVFSQELRATFANMTLAEVLKECRLEGVRACEIRSALMVERRYSFRRGFRDEWVSVAPRF